MKISAAVMTSLTGAKQTYLQDWEKWIKEGLVDELNPMVYTADNSGLKSQLITMISIVKDYADIVAGIYPQDGGGGRDMVAEQIDIVESLNILGVSKFSSRHIFGTHLEKAFVGLHRDYIVLPTTTKEALFNAYIENLKEKTLGYYIDKTNDDNLNNLITTINSFTEQETIEAKMIEILNIINLIENETIKQRLIVEHNKLVKYMNR